MNELVFLGGRQVAAFGPALLGLGETLPTDLLAYRQEWEPYIQAHLDLWRYLNQLFEAVEDSKKCPPGIFTDAQIQTINPPGLRPFCASLALTRIYTSDTHPSGILTMWNAWRNKSSAEVVAGAAEMLKWHQQVVMTVGGPYKDEMLKIADFWGIKNVKLPDVPTFDIQQSVIATIEGAYVTAKGVLQIIGYGAGEGLKKVANTATAIADGLSHAAEALPTVISSPLTWIGVAAVVAIVGGALVVYYLPRSPQRAKA